MLDQLWDSPLLRVYDEMSGSQPDDKHRMLACDARMRPDTDQDRPETLKNQANRRCWENTPYISFTNSPQGLWDVAEKRMHKNRGDQHLVVVGPRVRIKLGLPVLHYAEEMAEYKIPNPDTKPVHQQLLG